MQTKYYIVQNTCKEYLTDNYVQTVIYYDQLYNIVDFAALIYTWKDLNNNFCRDIRQSTKYIIFDKFVKILKEIIEYYRSIVKSNTRFSADTRLSAIADIFVDRFDKKKAAFQRNIKATEYCLLNQQLQYQY